MITKLEWDSTFFGYPVGKIYLKKGYELNESLFENALKAFKLVYVFTKVPLHRKSIKFVHVDDKVTFKKSIVQPDLEKFKMTCSPFNKNEDSYNDLVNLAYESGKFSRFRIDQGFIENEFERLYKKWIDGSINNKSSAVLIYSLKSRIAGFITLSDKGSETVNIGLIAVSPENQGKGIGSKLLRNAEIYSKVRGFSLMTVSTQQINLNAMRLYFKNGYEEVEIQHIYHYWNS